MNGSDPGQRDRAGGRAADHDDALRLPELHAVHGHGAGGRRHRELHPAALVARLLGAAALVSKFGGELVDGRHRRRRGYVPRERGEIHRDVLPILQSFWH